MEFAVIFYGIIPSNPPELPGERPTKRSHGDNCARTVDICEAQSQLPVRFAERNFTFNVPVESKTRISPERKQARFCA